jgi:hypothetical protein
MYVTVSNLSRHTTLYTVLNEITYKIKYYTKEGHTKPSVISLPLTASTYNI